jgi:hypothetical protein
VLQGGYLNCAALNVNGTAERGAATTEQKNGHCSATAPGLNNETQPALRDKSKIYLLQLHIKLGLIKVYVKAVDK